MVLDRARVAADGDAGPELRLASGRLSCGEGADLDQIVGQDPVSGPDPGAFGAVDAGAVPAVAAFEAADAAFGPGAPFDGASEGFSVFFGASGLRGSTSAWDHHGRHAEVVKLLVDLGFAIAA